MEYSIGYPISTVPWNNIGIEPRRVHTIPSKRYKIKNSKLA